MFVLAYRAASSVDYLRVCQCLVANGLILSLVDLAVLLDEATQSLEVSDRRCRRAFHECSEPLVRSSALSEPARFLPASAYFENTCSRLSYVSRRMVSMFLGEL